MFELSKIAGAVLDPRAVLFALLVLGTLLLWTPARKTARRLITFCVAVAIFCNVVPVGEYILGKLEYRFPLPPEQIEAVDGIVVLGGDFQATLVEAVGTRAGAPPRLVVLANLARRYPQARIVFSGGSGNPARPDLKEADLAKPILADLGVDTGRVVFESEARNTYENAVYTYRLAKPNPGETWLLVTTAWHVPRAVGTFRRAGWTVIPYPVDFGTAPTLKHPIGLTFDFGMTPLAVALHEVAGLIVYYVRGQSDALFPGPQS